MTFAEYLYWHFLIAPNKIIGLMRNYLIGTWHRFMIVRHLKTLFAPWHRLLPSNLPTERTIGNRIMNAVLDFYIRIVAAVIRLGIILAGLFVQMIYIFIFFALLIIWILWPVVLIVSLGYGISLL